MPVPRPQTSTPEVCGSLSGAVRVTPVPCRSRGADRGDHRPLHALAGADGQRVAGADIGQRRQLDVGGARRGGGRKRGLGRGLADRSHGGDLGIAAQVDADLLADGETLGAVHRQVRRAGGEIQPGPGRDIDEHLVGAVAAVPALFTLRLSPPTTISAPGERSVVLRRLTVVAPAAAGRRQAGIGKAQQVMRTRRDLRAGGNDRQRHRRRPCAGIDQPPARDVHRSGARVVKLDELVGGIAARGEAHLIELDRLNAPHPLLAHIGAAIPGRAQRQVSPCWRGPGR